MTGAHERAPGIAGLCIDLNDGYMSVYMSLYECLYDGYMSVD